MRPIQQLGDPHIYVTRQGYEKQDKQEDSFKMSFTRILL